MPPSPASVVLAQSEKIHQYYQCVTNRHKGDCKKKTMKKQLIEDIVAKEIVGILNSERMKTVIKNVLAYSEKESNTDAIKYLRKQLRENESATANLIAALESGKAVDVIAAQIEKRQAEKTGLELQLAKEQILSQSLTYEQVDYFLRKFKYGNTSDIQYRQSLVDMFISKMLLFDDKLVILCNISEHKIEIPLDELLGSSKGRLKNAINMIQFQKGCIVSYLSWDNATLILLSQKALTFADFRVITISKLTGGFYGKDRCTKRDGLSANKAVVI